VESIGEAEKLASKAGRMGNLMGPVKPNTRRYSSNEALPRRQQVVVSRQRMGYTNITHAHRLSDDPKPYCNECEQDLTV
jgi:hypothetical protein